jgi:hypothetical protein
MKNPAALINEVDGGINSKALISEFGIHTINTTTDSSFGHSLFGYIGLKTGFSYLYKIMGVCPQILDLVIRDG